MTTDFSGVNVVAHSLIIQSDGKIVAVGNAGPAFDSADG